MAWSRTGFHILEHPADIGIAATGSNHAEAFANAARGLFFLILDPEQVQVRVERTIRVAGDDCEHLLVRWLSELLYIYDGEKFVIADVEIRAFDTRSLTAVLKGEPLDVAKHSPKLDVKAITYHQLKVEQAETGDVEIRVIVDI